MFFFSIFESDFFNSVVFIKYIGGRVFDIFKYRKDLFITMVFASRKIFTTISPEMKPVMTNYFKYNKTTT